jgi:hypothetical protein
VLAGAVVPDPMHADQFFADADLDSAPDDRDLDLPATERVADPVVRSSKRQVAQRVDLAGDRRRRR